MSQIQGSNGIFDLYRITPNGEDWLSYNPNGRLSFEQSLNPVRLNFVNLKGQQAKYLVNGVVYFPIVNDSEGLNPQVKPKYLYYLQNEFILQDGPFEGRVFMYIPPGMTYRTNTNISGWCFVAGKSLSTSKSLWTNLTDQYYLGNTSREILSTDCVPNCSGKTCKEDNGCGLPCGCSTGGMCSDDGSCLDLELPKPAPICSDNAICGGVNGQCYGNCPLGYQCTKDIKGKYKCQQIMDTSSMFGIFILLILILIVVAIITFSWVKNTTISSSKN